jgi:hypothetical protein
VTYLLALPPTTTPLQRLASIAWVFQPAAWATLSAEWRSVYLAQAAQDAEYVAHEIDAKRKVGG